MYFFGMDAEQTLSHAIDWMADDRDDEAEALLVDFMAQLREQMDGSEADAGRYYYWGRSLSLLDEPEQALLRFEKSLEAQPDHEGSWWETASILLYDLDRPESALVILEQRLLPLRPDYPLYVEARESAQTLIRHLPPPGASEMPESGPPEAGTP